MNRDADKSECKKYRLEKFLHAQIAQQEKKRQDSTQNKFKISQRENSVVVFQHTHMSNEAIELFSMPHRVYGSIPNNIKY